MPSPELYIGRLRLFVSNRVPAFDRVLLIESGSRELLDDLLPGLYSLYPGMRLDLVTCYAGQPAAFLQARGDVYRVTEYVGREGRKRLYRLLGQRRYQVVGMICSAEPIMTKWKWVLALRLPAKVFMLNENGDYFWLDRGHWKVIRHFVLFRAGLTGAGAVATLARLAAFPFTVLYLLLYAATVHFRRWLRT